MDKIFIKLTTVPQNFNIEEGSKELQIYKSKYEDYTDDVKILKRPVDHYLENSSKNPLFAKIHSISFGFISEDTVRVKILEGEESDILKQFLKDCKEYFDKSIMVLWNNSFSLPFITTRMMKNKIDLGTLHDGLKHLGLREWNLKKNKGLQSYLEGVGWFKGSLEQWAFNLGLDTSLIDGSDVYKYVEKGDLEPLRQSDADYIFTMVQLDRLSEGNTEVPNINIVVDNLYGRVIEEIVDERNPLEKLYTENQLTESIKLELETVLKKKKPTKKEKLHLINMIHTLSCNTEMFKSDKPDVVKEKLIEAEEFINKL